MLDDTKTWIGDKHNATPTKIRTNNGKRYSPCKFSHPSSEKAFINFFAHFKHIHFSSFTFHINWNSFIGRSSRSQELSTKSHHCPTHIMSPRTFIFAVLFCGFTISSVLCAPLEEFCFLCADGVYPANAERFIDANGKTCQELDAEMFNPSNDSKPGNAKCTQLQNQYRNCCCNNNANCSPIKQNPAPAPPPNPYPTGRQPVCHLCNGGTFPKKPYTLTTVYGIPGNPTCEDLYYMGRAKQIDAALCYPLQLYMRGPCGC